MIHTETTISYYDETMFISSDERKMVNRIMKLKNEHPGEVKIIAEPSTNDGCVYAKMPANWLRIGPPKKVVMSDEHRQQAAERLRLYRKEQKNSVQPAKHTSVPTNYESILLGIRAVDKIPFQDSEAIIGTKTHSSDEEAENV